MRQTPTLKEIYALELINTYFEQFGILLLSDKPDLISIDGKVGIEVTSGFSENDEKAISFDQMIEQNKIKIERKRQLRGWLNTYLKYKDSLPRQYKDMGYLQILNQRIQKKRSKVKGYTKTDKLGLFITTEIDQDLRKSLYEYINIFDDNRDVFDFLILDISNWSYVIYIDDQKHKVINYEDRKYEIAAIAADKFYNQ